MTELLLLVTLFLSSRFTEYAVLAIIVIYGGWSIYMKTTNPDVYLAIQDAEDRRRAAIFAAISRGSVQWGQRISMWLETTQSERVPTLPSIDVRAIQPNDSDQGDDVVVIEHSGSQDEGD